MFQKSKKTIIGFIAGLVLGVGLIVGLRYFNYKDPHVHYHANFALYINGQLDKFDNFTFYEEIQSCADEESDNPRTRVHLHNDEAQSIHIHDTAATWGHLFANLGYVLSDQVIKTDEGVFVDSDPDQLTFILNGKEVSSIANVVIGSEDVLLINYGTDDSATLSRRFDGITRDAATKNQQDDPATCSGSKPDSAGQKLKKSLWF